MSVSNCSKHLAEKKIVNTTGLLLSQCGSFIKHYLYGKFIYYSTDVVESWQKEND